ncbi:MAG: dihydroorotase, partial [Firmicutes bacterium]|nr:dihydroorotase [Bacillota bacterium]
AVVNLIKGKAAAVGFCRVFPVGALTGGRAGREAADFELLYRAGVRAFSDDGSPVADSHLFLQIMRSLANFPDVLVIAHSEDLTLSAGGLLHEGEISKKLGLPGIPAAAETAAVARDIILAQAAGVPLHLAHLSTAGSVELLAWAKERGLQVTAEVTPHHLLLTEEEICRSGAQAKVNPPLRSADDRLALVEALRSGLIDIIATDHAPHSAAEKAAGLESAPCGIAGLETAVPMLLTGLVDTGMLTLFDLVKAYSSRPAELMGLEGGTLRPGAPADIVVVNLEARGAVDPERFYSLARLSPFAGRPYRGQPVMTIVGGEIKMENGVVHGKKD